MSTKEIKDEIQKLLNNVPDDVLKDLLKYLKEAQNQTGDKIQLSLHLKKIISEDQELLERLAK